MSNSKDPSDLSYEELKLLLEGKKNQRISMLQNEIAELEAILSVKNRELIELTGLGPVVKSRHGRKPKGFPVETGELSSGARRGRSSVLKIEILAFLRSKGKEGAHVDEIAEHVGKPKVTVNAFLATTGKKAGIKGKGKRSGVYYLNG